MIVRVTITMEDLGGTVGVSLVGVGLGSAGGVEGGVGVDWSGCSGVDDGWVGVDRVGELVGLDCSEVVSGGVDEGGSSTEVEDGVGSSGLDVGDSDTLVGEVSVAAAVGSASTLTSCLRSTSAPATATARKTSESRKMDNVDGHLILATGVGC